LIFKNEGDAAVSEANAEKVLTHRRKKGEGSGNNVVLETAHNRSARRVDKNREENDADGKEGTKKEAGLALMRIKLHFLWNANRSRRWSETSD